jgi:hypothetical protein
MNRNEPIQILSQSRAMGRGRARRLSLSFASRKELRSNRLHSSVFAWYFPQNILIFSFFSSSSCIRIHDDACSSLFLFNVIIIIFLIRQVHPSFWRRRLRKSVRPLPAVPVGMNLMTRNQSLLIAINRRIPSTSYSAHVHKSSFLRV